MIRAVGVAAAALMLLIAVLFPGAAMAHGNIDQSLDGDPGCSSTNFPAGVTASGGQRQRFVPTGDTLSSVALCVSATTTSDFLTIAIFGPGGGLVAAGSSSQAVAPNQPELVPVGSRQFVHIDFLQGVSVTAGATYALEIGGGLEVTWWGTPADGSSPYDYCAASPTTSQVRDFGFRTYLAEAPGEPPACEAVPATPTATPAPQPTRTPHPDPTEETEPTAAAENATSAAATATAAPNSGAAATGGGPSADATVAARPTGRTAGAGASPRAVPNAGGSGGGESARNDAAWLIAAAGAAMVCAGLVLRRRVSTRPWM